MKTGANRAILVVPVERYRPVTVWCIEPARECGRDALWEQEIEAPAARGEARKGRTDFLSSVLRPSGRRIYVRHSISPLLRNGHRSEEHTSELQSPCNL